MLYCYYDYQEEEERIKKQHIPPIMFDYTVRGQ